MKHLQVVLPLEGLRTDVAQVFALIAVRKLVLGQSTGVAELLATHLALLNL